MLGTLHLIDSENIEFSNNTNTANSPAELWSMLPESGFQQEQNDS